MQPVDETIFRHYQWKSIWPVQYLIIIAFIQMLLTFIIIGLETWSMVVNIKYSFLFIGYITAFVFTINWISTFIVVCCNRDSRGCIRHTFIENILSTIASSILIYYDVQFLKQPWTCLWSEKLCSKTNWDFIWSSWWKYYTIDVQYTKLLAIKIQLSCAVILLSLSLLFILIYIYTSLKIRSRLAIIDPHDAMNFHLQQQISPPPVSTWTVQTSVWRPSSII